MIEEKQKPCILLIDDDPMQLMMLGRILSPQYDVKMAKGGRAGLKLAAEHNIDLVLLDLVMEDISGFEALAHLKESEETKDIPVIFVSSSTSNDDEIKGLALGAVDYIRKPYTEVVVNLRVKIHLQLVTQVRTIKNFSMVDGLTGVNNRRSFDQMVKSTWSYTKRAKGSFSVLLLDIDDFKLFNEKYGYANGDICLKVVANTIREVLKRGSDSVYRWGGEEFAILLPSTPLDGAVFVAEDIRKSMASTSIHLDGEPVFVTVSMAAGTLAPAAMDANFDEVIETFYVNLEKALRQTKGCSRIEKIDGF